MKRYTNGMVAHVWAQQTEDSGSNSNESFYFIKDTIYSYGSHFPIAKFIQKSVILFNSDKYSITTSQHQSLTRHAIPYHCIVIEVPNLDVRIFKKSEAKHIKERYSKANNENLAYLKNKMIDSLLNAKRARKESNITYYLNMADELCNNYNNYLSVFKIRRKKLEIINDSELQAIIEKRDKAREQNAKKARAKAAKAAKAAKKKITQWLAGEHVSIPYDVDKVYLRLNPENSEEVQTSKHAAFPVSHAIRAYKILKRVCQNGTALESKINIGHFTITSIDSKCGITAGCHYVTWPIIEQMGEYLLSIENNQRAKT